jgi:hypothetical protein
MRLSMLRRAECSALRAGARAGAGDQTRADAVHPGEWRPLASPRHNRRQHPSAARSVATIGEEPIVVADAASAHVIDVFGADAGLQELCVDDSSKIDMGPAAPAGQDDVMVGGGVGEAVGDVGTDLEAASFDVRADGGDDVDRGSGEGAQRLDGCADDVLGGGLPAAVDGGDGAAAAVGEQHGCAVRHAHGAGNEGIARHDGVALGDAERLLVVGAGGAQDDGAVDLVEEQDLVGFYAEVSGGDPEVLVDVGGVVADADGEVERVEGGGADAAGAGEEGVVEACCGQQAGVQGQGGVHAGHHRTTRLRGKPMARRGGARCSPNVPGSPMLRFVLSRGTHATS